MKTLPDPYRWFQDGDLFKALGDRQGTLHNQQGEFLKVKPGTLEPLRRHFKAKYGKFRVVGGVSQPQGQGCSFPLGSPVF